jgi:hypothetical protein
MRNLKTLFMLFIFISINGINGYSQSEYKGLLKLKIRALNAQGNKIDSASIKVFENDKQIKTVKGSPGIVILDLNRTYIIEVSDNDYKKYLYVNSSVPVKLNDKICPFSFKYRLYESTITAAHEKPTAEGFYEKGTGKFKFRHVVYSAYTLNDFK